MEVVGGFSRITVPSAGKKNVNKYFFNKITTNRMYTRCDQK